MTAVYTWFREGARLLLVAAAVCFGLGVLSDAWAQSEGSQESAFFFAFGKEVPVRIALDQIGVLAAEGATEEQLKGYFAKRGLRLARALPSQIFILQLDKPLQRPALVKLARELTRPEPKLVVQAGLVATPEGAQAPMLISDRYIVQLAPSAKRQDLERLAREFRAQILMQNPLRRNQFLLRTTEQSALDSLQVAKWTSWRPLLEPVRWGRDGARFGLRPLT
jgi:hypothetical protein